MSYMKCLDKPEPCVVQVLVLNDVYSRPSQSLRQELPGDRPPGERRSPEGRHRWSSQVVQRPDGGAEDGHELRRGSQPAAVPSHNRQVVEPGGHVADQVLELPLHPVAHHGAPGGAGDGKGVVAIALKIRARASADAVEKFVGLLPGCKLLSFLRRLDPFERVVFWRDTVREPVRHLRARKTTAVPLDEVVQGGPVLSRCLLRHGAVLGLRQAVRLEGVFVVADER